MPMGYDLLATLQQQAQDREFYDTQQPVACPNDGTTLLDAPPGSSDILYCPHDGWKYPRDYDVSVHSGM